MVSAAKLRRAQDAILRMRPYSNKLDNMLRNILSNLDGDVETVFGLERPIQNALLVVVTSNRGLCGSFNSNVIKAAEAVIREKYANLKREGNLTVLPIGKRGYDHFRRQHRGIPVIHDYVELFSDLSFDHVAQVSQRLMDAFEKGEYDSIHIAYGRFKNAAVQFPEVEQWLPVARMESQEGDFRSNYIFEPGKESLLEYLIPTILKTTFHKYILDTHASEHGARMTAMDAATENADELLKELRISYNKARQEAITKELSEIVGGAAALEG